MRSAIKSGWDEETLFYDVTIKSPENGRGLMNYGLTLNGQRPNALKGLDYFIRATKFTPNYPTLEINSGIAYGILNQPNKRRRRISAAQFRSRRSTPSLISIMAAGSSGNAAPPKPSPISRPPSKKSCVDGSAQYANGGLSAAGEGDPCSLILRSTR